MKLAKQKTWPLFPIVSAFLIFFGYVLIHAPSYYFSPRDHVIERFVAGIMAIFIVRVVIAKIRKETTVDYIYYIGLLYASPFIAKSIAAWRFPNS